MLGIADFGGRGVLRFSVSKAVVLELGSSKGSRVNVALPGNRAIDMRLHPGDSKRVCSQIACLDGSPDSLSKVASFDSVERLTLQHESGNVDDAFVIGRVPAWCGREALKDGNDVQNFGDVGVDLIVTLVGQLSTDLRD